MENEKKWKKQFSKKSMKTKFDPDYLVVIISNEKIKLHKNLT